MELLDWERDTRHYSSPVRTQEGQILGQASRMAGSPCFEISDPRAAAWYSARSRPTQKQLCVPEGAPAPRHKPAGHVAPVSRSKFTEPPSRATQAQLPSRCPPCSLWVHLPLRLVNVLRTSPTPAALNQGPAPGYGASGKTSSEDTELMLRP